MPDTARRWVTRVPPDPHLRFDTNDYSLDPRAGRPPRRGSRRPARGPGGRAGHRRAGLPPAPRSFARHRTITALEHARALRDGRAPARDAGRGSAAGPLRRADRMSRPTTELAHLFRQLKAPGRGQGAAQARRPRPRRGVVLRAVRRRPAEDRDRQPRQPRRPGPDQGRAVPGAQDARGVRLRLPSLASSATPSCTSASSTSSPASENIVLLGPPGHRQDPPLDRARDPRLPGRPPRRVPDRDRMGRAARRRPTPRPPRRRARPPAADPAADRRRGRLHPVRPPGRQPDVHARLPPLRTRRR